MDNRFARTFVCGIGGIGTSGPAILLHELGYRVAGSDLRQSELTRALQELGIDVIIENGNGASSIDATICDEVERSSCVIVPAAFPSHHPVCQIAQTRHIPILSRTEALAHIAQLPQFDDVPFVVCMGTLSRARCARSLATIDRHVAGFCCGAAVRSPHPSPHDATRPTPSLHAMLGSPIFCDIDERDIFQNPALLDAFGAKQIVITDFATPDYGYYAQDQTLQKLVDIATQALIRSAKSHQNCPKSDYSLIFPAHSSILGNKIRFIERHLSAQNCDDNDNSLLLDNKTRFIERHLSDQNCDDANAHANAENNAAPNICGCNAAAFYRDEAFDFELNAKNGDFYLSQCRNDSNSQNRIQALATPTAVSGTRTDAAAFAAACVAATHHCPPPSRANIAQPTAASSQAQSSIAPTAGDSSHQNAPFSVGDMACIGWFERIAQARFPRCHIYYDIRMHPVSIAESLASIGTRHPDCSTSIVIRPFISTLKVYTAQTWAQVLRRAHAVFIANPPYEGCSRDDCAQFAEALCQHGLEARCIETAQALPQFEGALLVIGAPDMRAFFEP